ncbi:cyclic lactone autoinducer peptide [Clostridium estertheticum]|nr:cyclic lactone autoinducer peptide [Clostridium estertheticum]MBW9154625.1 cyclic lactone autoinducer peptide [Clostridium estertheticum]WLC86535.1 cyclic lactone autoinducer peptide [Clostridium estertheticum]
MKNYDFRKRLALVICSGLMAVAATSSSMCIVWLFNECKMPKSLYKID